MPKGDTIQKDTNNVSHKMEILLFPRFVAILSGSLLTKLVLSGFQLNILLFMALIILGFGYYSREKTTIVDENGNKFESFEFGIDIEFNLLYITFFAVLTSEIVVNLLEKHF